MKFTKPSLSIDQQISLLQQRGMAIPDAVRATHYLKHISYYRLRAYWLPFEQPAPVAGDHMFVAGTEFDHVLALYVFDRELRLRVMDARIEVSLRANWAHHMAMKHGSHGYLDAALYYDPVRYGKAVASLADDIQHSKDTFIIHYRDKYDDPEMPPVWMAAEIMSMGQLSKWLNNLNGRSDKQAIAKSYGLDAMIFISLAHHLAYVRNICAHHGRLWNRQFTLTLKMPQSPAALKLALSVGSERKVYNTLVMLGYLIGIVAPGSEWCHNIVDLIDTCPLADPVAMGFPANWRNLPMWAAP
jgi:abortive infection bacteriophage resistance protein